MKNILIAAYIYALLILFLLWIGIKCLFTWKNYRDAIIDFAFETVNENLTNEKEPE